MKTVEKLITKRDNNIKRISELIVQLHELHLENQELEYQLSQICDSEEEEDKVTPSTPLKSGDRAVVLSPDTSRRGETGHIKSLSKSNLTATFRTDDNQEFPVRTYNLFRLKKRDQKSKK